MTQKSSSPGLIAGGLCLLFLITGCGRTPPVRPMSPPTPSEKLGWILRLEDQRVLRDPPPEPSAGDLGADDETARPEVSPAPMRPEPDLVGLLGDAEARIRRRAALAIGRVGRAEGVAPLIARLSSDPEPEVRQMSAFALGLIGDADATDALLLALDDSSPIVQARAAEALGRIGATAKRSSRSALSWAGT